jgi:integrase
MYKQAIRHDIVPALGHILVTRLQESDCKGMHRDMRDRPTVANGALGVLSSMMSWAEGEGLRPKRSNPCVDIERYPKPPKQNYLNTEGYQKVDVKLAAIKASPYAIKGLMLILQTGMRKSEVLDLLWDWVDLENEKPQIKIPYEYHKTGKTAGPKIIYLAPDSIELLKSVRKWDGIPRVFFGANKRGRCWSIDRLWRAIRAGEEFKGFTIHDLRHSFASMGINNGMSLEEIGKLLGHSDISTTQRYAHIAPERNNDLAQKAGGFISKAMKSAPNP